MDLWYKVLKEYDELVYIPLSSGLSGACNTAKMLAQDDKYEDKVFVVDNGRISVPLRASVLDAIDLAKKGLSASEIQKVLEASKADMSIYLGVETLEYLKRGGRITPATAAIGSALNIKPILRVDTGKLDTYKKCRGMKKVKKEILEALKNDLETIFKEQAEAGEVYLMAASSADEETAKAWVEEIKEHFPGMDVLYDHLSMGISCHTGEGALGAGCSCKPRV
jgi:DegV family protein with EDD domain